MKEFIISEAQTEKAVLVGLITPQQNEQKVKEYLDELAFLADTAGVETVKCFYQKLDGPNSVTFVGTGKLQEIKEYVADNEIGMVIFDDELSVFMAQLPVNLPGAVAGRVFAQGVDLGQIVSRPVWCIILAVVRTIRVR